MKAMCVPAIPPDPCHPYDYTSKTISSKSRGTGFPASDTPKNPPPQLSYCLTTEKCQPDPLKFHNVNAARDSLSATVDLFRTNPPLLCELPRDIMHGSSDSDGGEFSTCDFKLQISVNFQP